jgi:hypothetical protein
MPLLPALQLQPTILLDFCTLCRVFYMPASITRNTQMIERQTIDNEEDNERE